MTQAGYIYFMKRENGDIKIGYSIDVITRRSAVSTQQASKVDLLGAIRGTRQDERDFHLRYAETRVDGEWFTPSKELIDFIKANATFEGIENPVRIKVREQTAKDLKDFANGLHCSADEAINFLLSYVCEEGEMTILAGLRLREQLQFLTNTTLPATIEEKSA